MILVTGATGNVGRPLVEILLAEGAALRALTRTPATLRLPAEAEVMGADLLRPEQVTAALTGVNTVFLNMSAVGETTAEFLAIARKQGVRRVVMLSSSSVRDDAAEQPSMLAHWHKTSEDLVKESGLEWTILRPGEFASNALWTWGEQLRANGAVRGAYGRAATAPIHERDIAAVAVRALLTDDHIGKVYVLTGPESLTQYDKVRILGGAAGRPFRFEEISPEAAREDYLARGMQEQASDTMREHFGKAVDGILNSLAESVGKPAPLTSAVQEVTGLPPRRFAHWAAENATALRKGHTQTPSPREVVLELLEERQKGARVGLSDYYADDAVLEHVFGVFPPTRWQGREELRNHFSYQGSQDFQVKAHKILVHETLDPEVIVVEWEFDMIETSSGRATRLANIVVMRVRDGRIVESRDYHNHLGLAAATDSLPALIAFLKGTDTD